MKRLLAGATVAVLVIGGIAGVLPQQAMAAALPAPVYRYTDNFIIGGSGYAQANAVTTNPAGDVYIAGDFNGSVNFAGSRGNDTIASSVITSFLTKYNADGTYGWTRIFDTVSGSGSTNAKGLVVDSGGNVYMTGVFSGGVTFGGSDSESITGGGTFLSKFSSSGVYDWTRTIIPPSNGSITAAGVALDNSDNIYIGGSFRDTVNFAGSSGTDNHTDAGGNGNAFVTKFTNGGVYGWTRTMDTTAGGGVTVGGIAFGSNQLYITGYFDGTLDFDGSGGSDVQTSATSNSFVSSLNTDGSYGWSAITTTNAGVNSAGGMAIATDGNGNVYTTGSYTGSVNFAGTSGSDVYTQAGFSYATFLSKYSPSGSYEWTKTTVAGSGGSSFGMAITTDVLGNIYVLSGFNGPVSFGPAGTDTLNYQNDIAVSMYDANGDYSWTRSFDTTSGTLNNTYSSAALATDLLGNLYIASDFMGTVDFDPSGAGDTSTSGQPTVFLTSYRTFELTAAPGGDDDNAGSQPGGATGQLPNAPNTGVPPADSTVRGLVIVAGTLLVGLWYVRRQYTT